MHIADTAMHAAVMLLVGWSLVGWLHGYTAVEQLDGSRCQLIQGLASGNVALCQMRAGNDF